MPSSPRSTRRIIGDALGVVHRRFTDNDPPIVGTQLISLDADSGLEVRFLLPTEDDVARGAKQGLLDRVKQEFAIALDRSGPKAPAPDRVKVSISSLQAQGIRPSNRC